MTNYTSIPTEVVGIMAGKLGAAVVVLDKYAQANNQDEEIKSDMEFGRDSMFECLRLLVGEETAKRVVQEIEKRATA